MNRKEVERMRSSPPAEVRQVLRQRFRRRPRQRPGQGPEGGLPRVRPRKGGNPNEKVRRLPGAVGTETDHPLLLRFEVPRQVHSPLHETSPQLELLPALRSQVRLPLLGACFVKALSQVDE